MKYTRKQKELISRIKSANGALWYDNASKGERRIAERLVAAGVLRYTDTPNGRYIEFATYTS